MVAVAGQHSRVLEVDQSCWIGVARDWQTRRGIGRMPTCSVANSARRPVPPGGAHLALRSISAAKVLETNAIRRLETTRLVHGVQPVASETTFERVFPTALDMSAHRDWVRIAGLPRLESHAQVRRVSAAAQRGSEHRMHLRTGVGGRGAPVPS